MKAAVMYQKGGLPQYTDFPEPIAQHDDEVLVTVKAVAIKHWIKAGLVVNTIRAMHQKKTERSSVAMVFAFWWMEPEYMAWV